MLIIFLQYCNVIFFVGSQSDCKECKRYNSECKKEVQGGIEGAGAQDVQKKFLPIPMLKIRI